MIVACPVPQPYPSIAMLDRLVHRQPLRRWLLSGDDDIDSVIRAQTMIRNPKQAIGVRWQIDPYDVRLFVGHEVDETGILVTESVVVLTPDMRGEKIIERGNRSPPAECA